MGKLSLRHDPSCKPRMPIIGVYCAVLYIAIIIQSGRPAYTLPYFAVVRTLTLWRQNISTKVIDTTALISLLRGLPLFN